MYFNKYDHPANFNFNLDFEFKVQELGEDVFKLTVNSERWPENFSQAELDENIFSHSPTQSSLTYTPPSLTLRNEAQPLIESLPGLEFGVCGTKWMFCFAYNSNMKFYGLGEKNNGFEKTGIRTTFWNTDVFADFDRPRVNTGVTDPMYVSIPYLIIKQGNTYNGILLDNPFNVFVNIHAPEKIENMYEAAINDYFMLGSTDGRPTLYFMYGPSLPELCRKLQRLCGVHHRPPLWALGHHQCRWGYTSARDLEEIHNKYLDYNIPNDGLWLDIDYMEKFKVFTFDQAKFKDAKQEFGQLQSEGRHCVTILDPGVKIQKGYSIYDNGHKDDIFCHNREGGEYVGFVWPGATAFPDFSLPEGRSWWAGHTADFLARSGLDGFWLDMNDPSTGSAVLEEMLFNRGRLPHGSYHNQYALGMQRATYEGFLRHDPEKRPFLVSRSGFISSSRYSAIWTGDNIANYHHLRQSIPMCLNLSLSGIPFCGPDVPGFDGDPSPDLARDWYKAGFLFPFFRNHSNKKAAKKEPWSFDKKTTSVIRRFIRLRYKLIPYLYQIFIEHESQGDPILRTLFYEFEEQNDLPLSEIEDQFMIGPAIMQAPFLHAENQERQVVLPQGGQWFNPWTGEWFEGGQVINVRRESDTTPVFIRENAAIPALRQIPRTGLDPAILKDIELNVFSPSANGKPPNYEYIVDDGLTFGYRKGESTVVRFSFELDSGEAKVQSETMKKEAGAVKYELRLNKTWDSSD